MTQIENRYVLLDRDGVINKDLPRSVCNVAEFEMIPGTGEAIAELNRKGYHVLVISNQACVGRGDLTLAGLESIHGLLQQQLARFGGRIERFFVCPHVDEDNCNCRKPKPGLIDQAHETYGFERAATWIVGDSVRDIDAALKAGCRAALVRTGKGSATNPGPDVPVFDDLAHFARELEDWRKAS